MGGVSGEFEPQSVIAEPGDARIDAGVFEFGVEMGEEGGSGRLVFEPIDVDFDEVPAQLDPALDSIDELAVNALGRFGAVLRPEVMTEVVQGVKRDQA